MALYELVFIVRPEVSSVDIDNITENFTNILGELQGKVVKQEYWGLRNLAYEINNNRKGHYIMLCLDTPQDALKELERKMKLSEQVLRINIIKVEEFSDKPSPILQSSDNNQQSIDVTVKNKTN